jgi:hypothetical protein
MDIESTIAVTGGILIVLVPVAGLTARFALKPLIETIAKVMQQRRGDEALHLVERRLALLEKEMESMRTDLQQVSDAGDFHRKLAAPATADAEPVANG